MLGGVAIFSVLGYMSKTYGIPIEEAARPGQGLAFVVYPEALTTFWCPQLWSVTFFVMLYLLGIDSEVSTASCLHIYVFVFSFITSHVSRSSLNEIISDIPIFFHIINESGFPDTSH